ncbi:helix-turn-helix domain-containing protein [Streptomyces sp. NPDC001212]|uniref:helix-turn-helix domain-containing protein n=1 Tax=Streptomyces sp. NPDC048109 TaxID=3155482 RepID=UPI00342EDB85
MADQERTEDFAQLLARLRDTYGVTDSEISRRIGVSTATVNHWTHRRRAPKRDSLQALAAAFPKFTEDEIFAAAGRETPGPLSPDGEARVIELWRELTPEQQRAKEIEMRALGEANRTGR